MKLPAPLSLLVLLWVVTAVCAQTCFEELTKCREAARGPAALKEPCTGFEAWMFCVSNTAEYCDLDERSGVTFQAIKKEVKNSCDASLPFLMTGWDTCREMMECITTKTRMWDTLPNSRMDIINDTLSTEFWCGLMMEPEEKCILPHAEECHLPKNQADIIKEQLFRSKQVCQLSSSGAGGLREGTLSTVLLLSLTAAVARLIHA